MVLKYAGCHPRSVPSGGRFSLTNWWFSAEVLGLHRNTVRQRVAKFEQDRGGEAVNGMEISLALKLFDLLGDGG